MSFVTAISTANPPHQIDQTSIARFMLRAMQLSNEDARKLSVVFKASGIETRYSVLDDYAKENNFSFYTDLTNPASFPTTQQRNECFRTQAPILAAEAGTKALLDSKLSGAEITHLITVSCTGLYAPGLDIELVDKLQLSLEVQRVSINFMGCYAAFNALKTAEAFCKADANAKVLIVCVELCSLHFQRENTEDNLLSNALFGDGAAAVIMEATPNKKRSLKIAGHHSKLFREGNNDMAWTVGNYGFEMRLTSYVPAIIKKGIASLTDILFTQLNISIEDVNHVAVHPGGKKIVEAVEQALQLDKALTAWSWYVLKNYGNMSSPTVLFVLKEIFDRLGKENEKENILSFAFGPGLTLESMLFNYNHHD